MKRLIKGGVITLGVLLLLVACSKETATSAVSDEESIESLIESLPEWFDFTEIYTGDSSESYLSEGLKDTFEYSWIRWWRRIRYRDRSLDIRIHNDTATLLISRYASGKLTILVSNDTTPPETVTRYVKDFADSLWRRALFVRTGDINLPHRGWTFEGISNVYGRSYPQNTVKIDSVRVIWGDTSLLFTDPLKVMNKGEVPVIPAGAPINIEVYVNTPENILAFAHYHFREGRRRRTKLEEENGVFKGRWNAPQRQGIYHFGIDILNKNTLLTQDYPYDSETWIFVYRIVAQ